MMPRKRQVLKPPAVGKSWFLFTLVMFIISQSILEQLDKTDEVRIAILAPRIFNYVCTKRQMILLHVSRILSGFERVTLSK